MRVTVSVPDPIGVEAEKAAHEEGLSVSALYARAVDQFIRERRKKRAFEQVDQLIGASDVRSDALEQLERQRERSDREHE